MDQVKIGKFICELRKEKNMTQEELAEKVGVTCKSVSRLENGVTMPDISILMLLAEILNCTVQELLNGRRMKRDELMELKGTLENLIEYESHEQIKKDKKTNKYIFLGNMFLLVALMKDMCFESIFPENIGEFISGFFYGLSITFSLIGAYNNSHNISFCEKKKQIIKKLKGL